MENIKSRTKKYKSLKHFIENSEYKQRRISKEDSELEEYMLMAFLAAKNTNDFVAWIKFINIIS